MHLQPPLLIGIANNKLGIVPDTHPDNPNPWLDKLCRVQWNEAVKQYVFQHPKDFILAENLLQKPYNLHFRNHR